MIIEEVTLGALARALASAREEPTSQILCQAQAQAARSSRLGSARPPHAPGSLPSASTTSFGHEYPRHLWWSWP